MWGSLKPWLKLKNSCGKMIELRNPVFPFYRFNLLEAEKGILHFVSSAAQGNRADLNLNSPLGTENRKRLAQAVGVDVDCLTLGEQVHGVQVTMVGEKDKGRGALNNADRFPSTDALVTNIPGICLLVLTADCVPVLLYDPLKGVVAAVHAGWRGTVGKIVAQTVQKMEKEYGCAPAAIKAAIGPSVGKCCFEVGEEVKAEFIRMDMGVGTWIEPGKKTGKYYVDLWEVNRLQLLKAGLLNKHIEVAGICTCCRHEDFFSYRYAARTAGRFGSGIMLKS